MIWTIKLSENPQFVCIHLFSGDVLLATWTIDQMNAVLQQSTKFVKIAWTIVNINEIKFVEPYDPNEIEIFIWTQTDPQIKKDLQKIYDERKSKNLETNWSKHLREIYQTRKN